MMANKIFTLIMLLVIQAMAVHGQVSRTIYSEYSLDSGQLIKIDNKKMDVTIKTWNKNSVKLESTINGQQMQDISVANLFYLIGIEIRKSANEMRIESKSTFAEIQTPDSNTKNIYRSDVDLKDYIDSIDKLDDRFKLVASLANETYKIGKTSLTLYVPARRFLKVDNKYGDIQFDGHFTHIQIDVKNGNLKMQDVDSLKMDVKFGNVTFNTISSGKIDLENATLIGNRLLNVNLDSKSSTIGYKYGEWIKLDSKMDDVSIGNIAIVEGDKDFKQITIDTLRRSLNLDGENADIKINYLKPSVSKIDIKNKYATIKMPITQLQHFTVQVEGAASVFSPFDSDGKKVVGVTMADQGADYSLKKGNQGKASAQIRFRCHSCIVNLR